jgi:DnaK suppressor protein
MDEQATEAEEPAFDRERDLEALSGLEDDLVEIAAALRRLDDGSYGNCEVCAVPIPAVVDADPLATRCPEHPIGSATSGLPFPNS